MADPSVVQAKSVLGSGSTISLTLAAAPTNGNTVYVIIGGEASDFSPNSAGSYSTLFETDQSGFNTLRVGVFYIVASSMSATVTFNTTSGVDCSMTVIEVANAGTATAGTGQAQDFDSTPTVLGQTTGAANALHVGSCFSAVSDSGTNSGPAGYTGADILAATNVVVAYKTIASPGATGDQTFSCSEMAGGTSYTRGFVIEPTGGGGGGQPTQKRAGGVPWMGQHGAGFPSAIQRWIRRESGLQVPAYYRERRAA